MERRDLIHASLERAFFAEEEHEVDPKRPPPSVATYYYSINKIVAWRKSLDSQPVQVPVLSDRDSVRAAIGLLHNNAADLRKAEAYLRAVVSRRYPDGA